MNDICTSTPIDWNEYALCYDTLTRLKPYQDMIETIANLIPSNASSVLDLGCGTGTLLATIANKASAKLVGIDSSPQMLEVARNKLLGTKVQLNLSDLEAKVDFGGPYTYIVSTNVLYTLKDPLSFLVHTASFLSENGVLIMVTPKKGYDNGLILKEHCQDNRDDLFWINPHSSEERERMLIYEALGDSALASSMKLIAEHNRHITNTERFHFFNEVDLCNLMRQAGFKIQSLTTIYANQNFLAILTKE